ncbi:hypothetical protein [Oceanirhabdus seepicola]|uniref:Uncharacterized protein n=1 Tax=Oceanirhabdus seepicola TaxID=2828781 RepID=A0A9J6P5F4_9CLOT|nr:hypothetical protein [Oceanirhabdus seepicola]MCM1991943.1 hypothetical protein [Oceanirhabdus seepicola]
MNEINELRKELDEIKDNQKNSENKFEKLESKVSEINQSLIEINISQQGDSNKFDRLESKIEKMRVGLNHELNLKFNEHRQEDLSNIQTFMDRISGVQAISDQKDSEIKHRLTEVQCDIKVLTEKVSELKDKKKEFRVALLYPIIAAVVATLISMLVMAMR